MIKLSRVWGIWYVKTPHARFPFKSLTKAFDFIGRFYSNANTA